jgi:hypothetical protein
MTPENVKNSPPDLTFGVLFNRFKKKLINTACSVFTWENLPDSIDENFLTTELIMTGKIGIINTPDGVRAVRGNWGGEINEYYKPTRFVYANPVLGSGNPIIGKEIAVLFLTSADNSPSELYQNGLKTLINSTACLLADNQLSLNIAQKNTRLMLVASADNEATSNSAERALKDMYEGKPYKVVNSKYGDTIEVNPLVTTKPAESMQQLIENYQFIWSTFLQELGINSNFNLKRERLVQAEVALNSECMDTLIDDIEKNITRGVDMCNELFGTNIEFSVRRYGEEHAFKGLEERDKLSTDSVATSQPEPEPEKDGEPDGE